MTDRALGLLASLVLEDGRRWGDAAEPWQWQDAREVLDPGSETPFHFLTRPRGASKTSDLGGIGIAALLEQLPPGPGSYALAADRDQGRLLVDAVAGFSARTPGLASALNVDAFRVTATRSAASLEVLAADGPSVFGLRPHFVVVDEIAQWASTPSALRVWEAVYSAMPKMPGARLVVLTSAGDPGHWSHKVKEHARAQRRWRLHEVPGPCPWIPPAALQEQRALLTESQYARLHLNKWTAPEDRLSTLEDILACATLDGPQPARAGVRYVIGVDLALVKDRTAIAVCHTEPLNRVFVGTDWTDVGQRVVLDRLEVFAGSRRNPVQVDKVEELIGAAWRYYNRATVVADVWQMMAAIQRLRALGVHVKEFVPNQATNGRIASQLFQLLRNHAMALPNDEALVDELANVQLREVSAGVLRLDHEPGRHDDRAIAIAMAASELLAAPVFDPNAVSPLVLAQRRRSRSGGRPDPLKDHPGWEERCRREFDADRGRGAWDRMREAQKPKPGSWARR